MNTDWFETWTDPNDPTHVVMRRLSPEEAVEAQRRAFEKLAESLAYLFAPAIEQFIDVAKELQAVLPDEKAAARQRSKDDLKRKRKQLIKRRR